MEGCLKNMCGLAHSIFDLISVYDDATLMRQVTVIDKGSECNYTHDNADYLHQFPSLYLKLLHSSL